MIHYYSSGAGVQNPYAQVIGNLQFRAKKIIIASTVIILSFLSFNSHAQVSVTATAGTSNGAYSSVNAAFTAINAGTHQGAINIEISANTTEPAAPTVLAASGVGTSNYSSIGIYPTASNVVISGSSNTSTGILVFNGADNITINGNLNNGSGTTRNLEIQNNQGGAAPGSHAVLWFQGSTTAPQLGSTNIVIKNALIRANGNPNATSATSPYVVGLAFTGTAFPTSTGIGANHSNITLDNNLFQKAGTAIHMGNAIASPITGLNITNNVIGSTLSGDYVYHRGMWLSSISGTISNNIIFNVKSAVSSSSAGLEIQGSGSSSVLIERNKIEGVHNQSTGGWASQGILLGSGNNHIIVNNLVYDIKGINYSGLTTTFIGYGIRVNAGTGHKILYNSIHLFGEVNVGTSISHSIGLGIMSTSVSGLDIRNNIISNTQTSTVTGFQAFAIRYASSYNYATSGNNVNNNFYAVPSLNTSTTSYFVGGTMASGVTYYDLTALQAATGQDAQSMPLINSNAPFTADNSLTIPSGTITPLESGGIVISALPIPNTDYSGFNRPAGTGTAPDVGAFEFEGVAPSGCTGSPNAGTTSAPPQVCSGETFTVSASGYTIEPGIDFQWQSSVDNINFVDIAGQNSPSLSISQTSSTYYRLKVTCTNSSTSSYSNPSSFVLSPAALAGIYTINSGQPASGTNFVSIVEAVDALTCSGVSGAVTFNVVAGSGPYTARIVIPQISGASATNNITFNGNGETIQYSATVSVERAAILLNGADYVTINNFNIDVSGGTYGWGIQLYNQADFNTISNNIVTTSITGTSSDHCGVVISGSLTSAISTGNNANNTHIFNNMISGGYYGITAYGLSTTTYGQNNVIENNTIDNTYFYNLYAAYQENMIVKGNDSKRTIRTNGSTFYGFYLIGGIKSCRIENNKIHNTHDASTSTTSATYGIYINGPSPAGFESIIKNNILYNLNSAGGLIYAIYVNDAGVKIYHNSVSLDNLSATAGTTRGIMLGNYSNIDVKNNIVSLTRSGSGTKHGIYASGTTPAINNNNIYVNAPSPAHYGYWGGDRTSLTDWQTASGMDMQSMSVDPMFTNASSGDLFPNNNAVNNVGTGVGVALDILGNPRDAVNPDPGAYEFTPQGLDATITWVSPVNPVSAGPASVTVNINNTQTAIINSVTLAYTDFNSIITETFSGLGLVSGANTNLTFALPFNIINSHELRAYIISVNGVSDNEQLNDTTATQNICISLAGVYTINSAFATGGANYNNFTDAAAALNICGISGPVTFNVVPGSGPYVEQITINEITGSNAVNTVTINGNGETINYSSTNTNARAVIKISGADYLSLNNLVIDANGSGSYGWGIHITNSSDFITVNACSVLTSLTSTSSNYSGIVVSNSNTSALTAGDNANNLTLSNNYISGGYYGITHYGLTSGYSNNSVYENNQIIDPYSNGIYIVYSDAPMIKSNLLKMRNGNGSSDALYLSSVDNDAQILNNNIQNFGDYGIYMTSFNSTNTLRATVANNMISAVDGLYGIYMPSSKKVNVWYNSVNIGGTGRALYISSTTTSEADIRNNSFAYTGTSTGYAMYISSTSSVSELNYNNYYSTGTNFVYYGSAKSNLAALQATNIPSGNDLNSHSGDPLYTSAIDLHANGPQLNNKAIQIAAITTDIDGDLRYLTTPDIGADEYTPSPFDLSVLSVSSPVQNGCFSNEETVTLLIKNLGTTAINFSVTPVIFTVNVSGASNQTTSYTLNNGTLASLGIMSVSVGALDLTVAGIHSLNANALLATDGDVSNNSISYAINSSGPFPQVTSTVSNSRCGIGTVDLSASASAGASLNWYANATGGATIGTGNTFTTPVLNSTTTYYAAAIAGGVTANAGLAAPVSFSGYNSSSEGLAFNVNTTITLSTVTMYSQNGGTIDIYLKDASNVTINTATVTLLPGYQPSVVPLNFVIQPGNGYKIMNAYPNSVGLLYRENPFTGWTTLPDGGGSITITGGADINAYYYFYNWQITTGCESPRVPVTATVNPAPAISVSASLHSTCGGEPTTLSAGSTNSNYTYVWNPGNHTGSSITVSPTTTTTYYVTATDNSSGPDQGCVTIDSIKINVTQAPIVSVTSPVATLCEGESTQINATATLNSSFNIGNGSAVNSTTTYPTPYGAYYEGVRSQFLVLASELAASGLTTGAISGLSFNVTNVNSSALHKDYTIKIGHSSLAALTSTFVTSGLSTVFGPVNYYPVNGVNTHAFTTNFIWDGVSNIIIEICHNNYTGITGVEYTQNASVAYSTTPFVSAVWKNQDDNSTVCTDVTATTTSSNRPNITFNKASDLIYSWSPVTGLDNPNSLSPVAMPGDTTVYTLSVTDNITGCNSSESITINVNPVPVPVITASAPMPLCGGESAILTTQYSAADGYQFSWNGGLFNTESILAEVATTYECVVTSPDGCTSTSVFFTVEIANIFADISSVTDVSCNGGNDGSVEVEALGSILDPLGVIYYGPFDYSINGGALQSSPIFTGLSAGTYSFEVHDPTTGCVLFLTATVDEPAPLQMNPVVINQNVSCNGLSDGSAVLSATGGVGPYTFVWNTPVPKQGETNDEIPVGTWVAIVTDANGCTSSATVTITEPQSLTASVSFENVSCNGANDGSITVTANGGTAPYVGATQYSDLAPGTYTYTVTDANGCTSTVSATITEPAAVTVSATSTDVTCNGLNNGTITVDVPAGIAYTVNGVSPVPNYGPGTYTVVASLPNGNGTGYCSASTTVSISEPDPLILASSSQINVSCLGESDGSVTINASGGTAPYTGTGLKSNLAAGNHNFTVTDANGCSSTIQVTITEPELLQANATAQVNVSCNGGTDGSVIITASGGTSPYSGTGLKGNLSEGTYSYTVTDANGCQATVYVTITQPVVLSVNITSANSTYWSANNGTAQAVVSGGTVPYQYLWSNGSTTASVNGLAPGTYNVTVTDSKGCTTSGSVLIEEPLFNCTGNSTHIKWGQGGWGGPPNGVNPATYLYTNFSAVFPNGLIIGHPQGMPGGCNRSIKLTSAQAVTNFLPSSGTPKQLNPGHMLNPTAAQYGNTFAAQVAALTLNIMFDANDPNFSAGSTVTFGDMLVNINNSQYNNWTVKALLAEANKMLACGGNKNQISAISDAIDKVNNQGNATKCPSEPAAKFVEGSPETGDELFLNAYPNPSTGKVTLEFENEKPTELFLTVMDLSGRIMVNEKLVSAEGVNTHSIDLTAVAKGVYIVNVTNADLTRSVRLIIQ